MKKFLISVLLVLLVVLMYVLAIKNVQLKTASFEWKSKNVQDVKDLSGTLDRTIANATQIKQQDYPESIRKLEESMNNLKKTKANYEAKAKYIEENIELGIIPTKEYKIERLWIALGKYAKAENINLKVDVVDSTISGKYDLEVTAEGEYVNITDFIYDIEKDDTLGFKILNFKLIPKVLDTNSTKTTDNEQNNNTGNNTTQTTTNTNTDRLKATFKIEGVGIKFD